MKNITMKNFFILTSKLLILLTFLSCNAQTFNEITYNEYVYSKFNNASLEAINNTKGLSSEMSKIMPTQFVYEEVSFPDAYRTCETAGINLEFSNVSPQLDFELGGIVINKAGIPFEINGTSIEVGDDISKLKGFIKNGNRGSYVFKISNNGTKFLTHENYISVKYNFLNIVSEIVFVVL